MIAGVISWDPSQLTPPKGLRNVWAPIAALYSPGLTLVKTNDPLSADVVDPTCEPDASRSTIVTPGSPSSPCSSLPWTPPPGLKSRQTAPLISPALGGGCTACLEF